MDTASFECPHCEELVELSEPNPRQLVYCPNCGEPFFPPRRHGKTPRHIQLLILTGVVALAVAGYVWVQRFQTLTEYSAKGHKTYYLSAHDPRSEAALYRLEEHLLSPDSAAVISGEFWDAEGEGEGHCHVQITVVSQNIYGARLRSEWGAKLRVYANGTDPHWSVEGECVYLDGNKTVLK